MQQPITAPKTILYVEDEADIRLVARMPLEMLGQFEVVECASGVEAIRTAPRVRPDLLLLDVMMPEMDGPATLEALRRIPTTANTPAIFMTAKVQASEVRRYLDLGAIGVIPKPFDPMTLSDDIKRIWLESQAKAAAAAVR